MEAAARILEERGLEGYTTNAVAERAGFSIGSLYQYFPNKDAITIALIQRETARPTPPPLASGHVALSSVILALRYELGRHGARLSDELRSIHGGPHY